jgi:dTDP-4-amino-4,6-dideoxygalactose transaminase
MTSSGTAALQLALMALGIGPGDDVLVPSNTFCADAHVVCALGARPVFVDCCSSTGNVTPETVMEAITRRTRAIIVVHMGGMVCDVPGIDAVAGTVPVIEDCAHAAGSVAPWGPVGLGGTIGCWSFHAVKPLACGEGGMLATYRADLADYARRLSWLGIDRGTHERTGPAGYRAEYEITDIGIKGHGNDVHAAIGRVQLRKLNAGVSRRNLIAAVYDEALQTNAAPTPKYGTVTSRHLYQARTAHMSYFTIRLAAFGIDTGRHYRPLSTMGVYGDARRQCPGAEAWYASRVSLPCWAAMTDEQVSRVADAIRRAEE